MKKFSIALLLAALACAGCASRYNIVKNNGQVITAKGKPRLTKDKANYLFKDASGQTNSIPAGWVREITPVSMTKDKSSWQFNGNQ